MTKLSDLKLRLLKNSKVRQAYTEQSLEFLVARELIAQRLEADLTQQEVAKRMKTTQSVIARMESGARLPSLRTLESYAHALGKCVEVHFGKRRAAHYR